MNKYTDIEFASQEEIERQKKDIRKTSNLIGAAFIVLWLLPNTLNGIISTVTKLFGASLALSNLFSDPAFIMVLQTVYSVLMFTLPFIMLPLGIGKRIGELAIIKRPKKKLLTPFLFIGIGASAFANVLTNNVVGFFETFGIHFQSPDIVYPQGIFGFLLSFLAIAVTPALVEEFATRGMVMGAAREHGEAFGLTVSAFFFSLMHGNLVQIPFAFVMGLIIGFAVIKTGSLVTGIAIHFANNAIAVSMTYLLELTESVILEGIISMAYLAVCIVLLFVGISLAQKRQEKVWSIKESEGVLVFGEKLKLFLLSPTVIISIGITIIECIGTISFG
ncbi:MAG: CPBP family intramembrane metalloprotease [Clostridia bacterium]|nr:CPBP family intramembrane metalloprotease [Clostridia bacterium]